MLLQIDFGTRRVQTLAGNGQKGSDFLGGGKGKNQQLNSPWDLAFDSRVRLTPLSVRELSCSV